MCMVGLDTVWLDVHVHCVVWRSSFFSLYQSGPAYYYVVVCSVVCGLRSFNSFNFESGTMNIKENIPLVFYHI